jgi:hypothetical protein
MLANSLACVAKHSQQNSPALESQKIISVKRPIAHILQALEVFSTFPLMQRELRTKLGDLDLSDCNNGRLAAWNAAFTLEQSFNLGNLPLSRSRTHPLARPPERH